MTWRIGPPKFLTTIGAAALAALICVPVDARAQSVTVTGAEGLEITGDLLGFDGSYLRLGTEHGVLTLDAAIVQCEGAACPDPAQFVPVGRIVGAPRLGALLIPALIESYATTEAGGFDRVETEGTVRYDVNDGDGAPILQFDLTLNSTESGFAALLADSGDMLLATRELTPAELAIAAEAGLGSLDAAGQMRMLAIDALVPVAAPGQAVGAISMDDLSRLFAGEIVNWAELGGPDLPVSLHLEGVHDGQMQAFEGRFLRAVERTPSLAITRHGDTASLLAALLEDPGGIGMAPMGDIGFAQRMAFIERCGAHPEASLLAVQSEDYPLTLPAYLYLPERRRAPQVDAFLRWLAGPEAQLVRRRAGVLTQAPSAIPLSQEGTRLAAAIRAAGPEVSLGALQGMLRRLNGLNRVTLTFRFDEGAATLDAASRSHARFLAQEIVDGAYDGQRFAFVGFSDGAGPASDNLALSRDRAEAVYERVRDLLGGTWPDGVRPEVMAFGEALPIGCDDTVWGRTANRRVELWVETQP